MIKVLVVEDSGVLRELLVHILQSDPEIQVIGTVKDGKEALGFLEYQKPDVITMDMHMPRMGGFEATQRIMETQPVPIVIVTSSWNPEDVDFTFRAMEAGALACAEKPEGIGHPDYEVNCQKLVKLVKLMSEVKVVKRWPRTRPSKTAAKAKIPNKKEGIHLSQEYSVIGMGASTGGPPVLQMILTSLPKDLPVPILIVQHISKGFLEGMLKWLQDTTGFPCQVAKNQDILLPGTVYLGPEGFHMGVTGLQRIELNDQVGLHHGGVRPSISYLFRSISENMPFKAIGVLLTGMGMDGVEELRLMKDKGCLTLVQDRESSVVYGMPGEAVKIGAATNVLSPLEIAAVIGKCFTRK